MHGCLATDSVTLTTFGACRFQLRSSAHCLESFRWLTTSESIQMSQLMSHQNTWHYHSMFVSMAYTCTCKSSLVLKPHAANYPCGKRYIYFLHFFPQTPLRYHSDIVLLSSILLSCTFLFSYSKNVRWLTSRKEVRTYCHHSPIFFFLCGVRRSWRLRSFATPTFPCFCGTY